VWISDAGFMWALHFNHRTWVSCWAPHLNSNTWCNFPNHFGYVGGPDFNLLFILRKTIPAFTRTNEERHAYLTKGTASTLWELILNRRFESSSHRLFRKPVFLFGDAIEENEEILFDGNYKWLRQIGEHRFFLPNMEWLFSLSYLQSMSLVRVVSHG